ncbi:hypothetical protein F5Y12DRAFT_545332 [Xylaria sp. FL1777]|nr:hypothetical protein F5Y12DRAFT_545332 [Xylaria sp. FL1777]
MFRAKSTRTGLRHFRSNWNNRWKPVGRIPLLGPVIWSVGACGTIYLGCAAYEVYQDTRRAQARGSSRSRGKAVQTFEELEHFSNREATHSMRSMSFPFSGSTSERSEFSDSQRLTVAIMGVTSGIHVAYSIMPSMMAYFVHVPSLCKNYTLLTSVFGHGGLAHLGLNLYGMYCFMPSAADSPTFKGSSAHLAAFYLSAGILSSLAQHATAIWPRPNFAMSSLGASGALFALFGIVGISFPDTRIGIILLPGSLPIGEAMACVALFDAVGILVGYPRVHLGHAAHLGGLALGIGYAKYGGDKRIWRPGRKITFKAMRSAGLI